MKRDTNRIEIGFKYLSKKKAQSDKNKHLRYNGLENSIQSSVNRRVDFLIWRQFIVYLSP